MWEIISNASSMNETFEFPPEEDHQPEKNLILALVLFTFCLATVLGNVLVIAAVARERYLHTVTNYFITSLAVADCLVGSIVMPFSAAVEMQFDRRWIFGRDLCDVWHSFDVLASTASILNLCVISMDRYWAITDPFTYPGKMTPKRAACFIALVWVCSSLISFPAIAWWRAVAVAQEQTVQQCHFTDDIGYLVFSSTVSFYGPLSVMVFTYYRIYRAAVAQTRSLALGVKQVVMASSSDLCGGAQQHGGSMGNGGGGGTEAVELTLRIHRGGRVASDNRRCAALMTYGGRSVSPSIPSVPHQQSNGAEPKSPGIISPTSTGGLLTVHQNNDVLIAPDSSSTNVAQGSATLTTLSEAVESSSTAAVAAVPSSSVDPCRMPLSKMNFSLSRKLAKIAKERKAAKTLGIVMGVFIACWLPFFVTNLLSAFCSSCIHDPEKVVTVVTWLGWLNSGMNPVIYACWSRDFRRAFARILCGCCPRLFHRWKRHSAKAGTNSTVSQSSTNHVQVMASRTPSANLMPPSSMTTSLSFSSLCRTQQLAG